MVVTSAIFVGESPSEGGEGVACGNEIKLEATVVGYPPTNAGPPATNHPENKRCLKVQQVGYAMVTISDCLINKSGEFFVLNVLHMSMHLLPIFLV